MASLAGSTVFIYLIKSMTHTMISFMLHFFLTSFPSVSTTEVEHLPIVLHVATPLIGQLGFVWIFDIQIIREVKG